MNIIRPFFSALYQRARRFIVRLQLSSRVKLGRRCDILHSFFEGNNAIGDDSSIQGCYFGIASYIGRSAHLSGVKVGRYTCIADSCVSCIGNHPTSGFVSMHPAFYYNTEKQIGFTFHKGAPLYEGINKFPNGETKYNIIIGNDVWIGNHVLLMGGVTIGDGAVVAAGSVVTNDVEPFSIVAGVPARVIRLRFNDEQRVFLEQFKWWDQPIDHIMRHYLEFADINAYYDNHKDEI